MGRSSVIVYGPQGSGKTTNAEEMKRYFGLKKVIDGYFNASDFPLIDYLILTNLRPSLAFTKKFRSIRTLTVEDAKRLIGPRWQA